MGQLKNEELLNLMVQKLKELRLNHNLSQEKVYFDTNIHIARIEAKKLNITVSTLYGLCSYFKISLSDFFKEIDIELPNESKRDSHK